MRAPHSYTTEDVVEIFLPGSLPLANHVVGECIRRGARFAGPGEFTRRAYLNGRIDAVQVEGVLSIIESASDDQRAAAMERLQGRPTREASQARAQLLQILAAIEAYLDFTDEETEALDRETLVAELRSCRDRLSEIDAMLARRRSARSLPSVVILGPPNAGKSCLFRTLCPQRSVIVSSVPGTTRDLIEGTVNAKDSVFRLFDAPGVMETEDPLERLALSNLEGMLSRIHACLILWDGSLPPDRRARLEMERLTRDLPCIHALNKSDLGIDPQWDAVQTAPELNRISALTRDGLDELVAAMCRILPAPMGSEAAAMDVGIAESVRRARIAMDRALEEDWVGGVELVAMEIREAFDALSAIALPVTGQDLLDAVFARFCIGK
jgi:tRNA modification GTPase